MEFEWDERKRAQVLEDRDLDFVDTDLFFDGRAVSHQSTPRPEEERWKTTAIFEGRILYFGVMLARRKVRIITMRRAHEK